MQKQEIEKLKKAIENSNFNSLIELLIYMRNLEMKELCFKYLYEYGKNLVYDGTDFVEEEFPEDIFEKYVVKFINDKVKIIDSVGDSIDYLIHIVYTYAIANKYNIYIRFISENIDIFVNKFTIKGMEENIDKFDKKVLDDCYEYLLNAEFVDVIAKREYFFIGVYYLIDSNIMGSKTLSMVEKIKEFIKRRRTLTASIFIICCIIDMQEENIDDKGFSKFLIEAFFESNGTMLIPYAGALFGKGVMTKKQEYFVCKTYVENLKNGIHAISTITRCYNGRRLYAGKKIIKYICDNFMDLWDDLRSVIKGTKYCNEKWECCKEGIFDVFDV